MSERAFAGTQDVRAVDAVYDGRPRGLQYDSNGLVVLYTDWFCDYCGGRSWKNKLCSGRTAVLFTLETSVVVLTN